MRNLSPESISGATATLSADALALLDALPEPALAVTASGEIHHANKAATARFGKLGIGSRLVAEGPEQQTMLGFLQRASGTRQPIPGLLHLGDLQSPERFKAYANVIVPAAGARPAILLLRLSATADPRFGALTQKIAELNAEIRRRRRGQAVLEESVAQRDLLVRELHHRVKNNMQMLAGMLASAEREATNEQARAVLAEASRRLVAVGAVQQMLYRADSLESVEAGEFLRLISRTVLQTCGHTARAAIHADSFQLRNDLAGPVALILNELIANAHKYGHPPGEPPEIRIELRQIGDEYCLSVQDNGPGFDLFEARGRTSGLGLVRGLVRKLGGKLTVEKVQSSRVVVQFRDRSMPSASAPAS